ncbi:uncharacterized protein [Macrobrachium rosenbergii]|uniref:uncharacterized protein n=1 Tax=Macrobrachium rosenbergii TaxID=79674 RepID=UPI0034D78ADE
MRSRREYADMSPEVAWGSFPTEAYKPEPLRCLKCQRFGHHSSHCTVKEKCGICSKPHSTKQCLDTYKTGETVISKCTNCSRQHHAWNKCCSAGPLGPTPKPKQQVESTRMEPQQSPPAIPLQYPPPRPRKQRRTLRRKVDYSPKPRETDPSTLPSDPNPLPPSRLETLPSLNFSSHPSPSSSDVPASASRESATTSSDTCITKIQRNLYNYRS